MNISNEEYHADTSHISKSGLDMINKSPAHYWHEYLSPNRDRDPTPAQIVGNATHTAILEPEKFYDEFYCLNDSIILSQIDSKKPKATAKYKDFMKQQTSLHKGKQRLSSQDMEHIQRMAESVRKHKFAAELLSKGKAEQSFFFKHEGTGAPCKIRPDWLSEYEIICDVKTTTDASENAFSRACAKYRYHVQNALYLDGVYQCVDDLFSQFVFIAVEKEPPYGVACYILDSDSVNLGRQEYEKNLATYMQCKISREWPCYSDSVSVLRLPNYKFYQS